MKKLLIFLFFISFYSFSQVCEKEIYLGEKSICLPKIEGMSDLYSNNKIKNKVDMFVNADVQILAFYVFDTFDISKIFENQADRFFQVQIVASNLNLL